MEQILNSVIEILQDYVTREEIENIISQKLDEFQNKLNGANQS